MYFVRFIQCPSAVKGGGGNQRLVSEGTAITQREISERDGGACERGWSWSGKGGVGEEAGGWNDGSLKEVCQLELVLLTVVEDLVTGGPQSKPTPPQELSQKS